MLMNVDYDETKTENRFEERTEEGATYDDGTRWLTRQEGY